MYYNIALLPPDDLAQHCIDWAQTHLKKHQNGYCLEVGKCFPHVTLASFLADEEGIELPVNASLIGLEKDLSPIAFKGFYIQPRLAKKPQGYWCGVEVQNQLKLQDLHEDIVTRLRDLDLTVRTPSFQEYWPHLTFGLVKKSFTIPKFSLNDNLWNQDGFESWALCLGQSDDKGRFLKLIQQFN